MLDCQHSLKIDVAHIWEIGSGDRFADLLPVALKEESLVGTVGVIVADLSNPGEVFPLVAFWLFQFNAVAAKALEATETKDPVRARKIRERIEKPWINHADKGRLSLAKLPVLIVGSKWDKFSTADAALRNVMAKSLRALAHQYGASLLYFSGKAEEATLMSRVKAVLNHHLFGTTAGKGFIVSPDKALFVPAGSDSWEKIGPVPPVPEGAQGSGDPLASVAGGVVLPAPLDQWAGLAAAVFGPPPPGLGSAASSTSRYGLSGVDGNSTMAKEFENFKELAVDSMRAQKNDELERYRKAAERRSRQASKLAALESANFSKTL